MRILRFENGSVVVSKKDNSLWFSMFKEIFNADKVLVDRRAYRKGVGNLI